MKVFKDLSEVREEYKQESKVSSIRADVMDKEVRKQNIKKIFLLFILVIIFFILYKKNIGTINLDIPLLSYSDARYYEVYVNDILANIESIEQHKINIIPGFVNINSYSTMFKDPNKDIKIALDGNIKLNVKSHKCFSNMNNKKTQMRCKRDSVPSIIEKTNDTMYKLKIEKINLKRRDLNQILYNDIFKEDIKEYIKEKGIYDINLTGKYNLVTVYIYFRIIIN